MVNEIEPNNTVATAQALNLGFDTGEVTTLTVSGSILPSSSPNFTGSFSDTENNGSITLADATGISAGSVSESLGTIFLSSTDPSGTGEDTEFFRVSSLMGQLLTVTASGIGSFDPRVDIYNSDGILLASNDDRVFGFDQDSFIEFLAPEDGDYFIAVQHFDVLQSDPFDSTSAIALGGGGAGAVSLRIKQTSPDIDYYSVDLNEGDIVGAAADGAASSISVFDPTGELLLGIRENLTSFYGSESDLAGNANDNVSAGFVAATSGTYIIGVTGTGTGSYDLDTSIHRPVLESKAEGTVQRFFLDFNGTSVARSVFDSSNSGTASLTGLSGFLANWGLGAADENAVIDAVVARFTQLLVTDIAATGGNDNFEIEVLNSRDHADVFGQANVSRVIIGGNETQLGLSTIGIAENIDIGNFDTGDQAVVLLDTLSEASTNPNSVNSLTLAPGVTKAGAVGTVVGTIAAHEAAHLLGMLHTNPFNQTFAVTDSGGVYLAPVGADGIFGNADDPNYTFGLDYLNPLEGLSGRQNAAATIAFGASVGLPFTLGFTNQFSDQFTYVGDGGDDTVSVFFNGQDLTGTANDGAETGESPDTVGSIVVNGGDGDNSIYIDHSVTTDAVITTGSGDDLVIGGFATNTISTGAGDDRLGSEGTGGTLDGGAGSDTYVPGFLLSMVAGTGFTVNLQTGENPLGATLISIENVTGGEYNDSLTGDSGDNVLEGRYGADFLDGGLGFDTAVYNKVGNGSVVVDLAAGTATGTDHGTGDTLTNIEGVIGSRFFDTITGDDNDNSLDGYAGADRLTGAGGNDRYYVDHVGDVVVEAAGGGSADFVFSTVSYTASAHVERLILEGTDNINATGADAQNDILIGNVGDNELDGKGGIDTMIGGLGNDRYFVEDAADRVRENADGGIADYIFSTVSFTNAANIERLYLSGTAEINATGLDGQADTLIGNSGANILDGKGGADILRGGLGNDRYYVDESSDVVDEINGGGGIGDYVYSTASFTTSVGVERLYLEGSDDIDATGIDGQTDVLLGNSGNNVLDGKGGADVLRGGLGNDTYYVDAVGDVVDEVTGGGGTSDFIYSTVSYQIAENAERLIAVEGAEGAVGLTARNFQNDIIIGNSGTNVFVDQFGRDIFVGGGGADFFRFIANLDPVNNVNRINDFDSADDQFQLQQTIYTQIDVGILDAEQFQLGDSASDADDRIIYDMANGVLYYDPDGSGATAQIEIVNVTAGITITADDFQIF